MKAEKPSRLSYTLNFIKAAYYGRHGFYKRMGVFLERVEAPEAVFELLKIEEKHSDNGRIFCCCLDLLVVSTSAIAAPYLLLVGLVPAFLFRYFVAKETNQSIERWEGYKAEVFDNFYALANIKDVNKKSKKNPKPDTNIYQQELGLDSIDNMLEDYRDWKDPEPE